VTLVDLAGSEKTSIDTGKEMQSRTNKINKSLSTLSDVVMAQSLNEDKRGETIPYKNSVLTWLLTNSLSGNAKISLIGTITPIDTSYDESMNTLQFLERAVVKGDAGIVTQPGSSSALSGLERDDKSLLTAEITRLIKLLDVKQNIITNYENILSEQCSEGSIGSTTDQFKVLAQNYKKEKDLSSSHYHDLKTKFR
jgi:Kinesin motor domain